MEKNREAYVDADRSYRDTGYDRYYNKMNKLDAEYEEFKDFLGLGNDQERERLENIIFKYSEEIKEQQRFIATSLACYANVECFGNQYVQRIYEELKDYSNTQTD